MKTEKILTAWFVAILMTISATTQVVFAYDEYITEQEQYNRLAEGSFYWINSPIILEDSIFFYYVGEADEVKVAGDFNDWKRNVSMTYTGSNDIWTLKWDLRLEADVYDYKLIVDDIWISDPNNTNMYVDSSGQEVSYFELEDEFIPNKEYPLLLEDTTYRFNYYQTDVNNIALVGDFNNWNPYSHPMTSLGGGEWEIEMEFEPGFRVYCFVVDGSWLPDPNNLWQYSDGTGNTVNILFVDGETNPY